MWDSKRDTDVKNRLWILWEKARVGWFERRAMKHVYFHMRNRSPVQVQCMKQGTQNRCSGKAQRFGNKPGRPSISWEHAPATSILERRNWPYVMWAITTFNQYTNQQDETQKSPLPPRAPGSVSTPQGLALLCAHPDLHQRMHLHLSPYQRVLKWPESQAISASGVGTTPCLSLSLQEPPSHLEYNRALMMVSKKD